MKKSVFLIMLSAFVVCGCCQRTEKTVLCEPYVIEGLAEAPEFWKVRPSQVKELCESVKVGKAEVIAETPAGLPVYAYFYGRIRYAILGVMFGLACALSVTVLEDRALVETMLSHSPSC